MKVTKTWRQAYFGAVMSGSLQLSHANSNKTGMEKEGIHPSPGIYTIEVKEFCLVIVWGPVALHGGAYPPIWYCQYTWQYHHQGTLYVGSHAGTANTRPPVAYISGANCNLQRITSGFLSGTHLFAKYKCSSC